MAIMITGGTGFLGSYLARYLVNEIGRDDVVIFEKNLHPERIADIVGKVTVVQGDVQEPLELLAAMNDHAIDRVLHLAFIAGTEEPGKALPYLRFQCGATANVYECARLTGIRRVVNASSHAVYGARPGRAVTEDDAVRPGAQLYATCKVWTENVAENYNARYGMEIVSLRLQSAYGIGRVARARDWAAGLLNPNGWKQPNYRANAELAVMGQAVRMPPPDEIDDFIHAADSAQAFWLALNADKVPSAVYNVAGEHRPIGDYTRILRELVPGAAITEAPMPRNPTLLDSTRIREELGFAPKWSLEDGLRAYVEQVRGK
ncbi:MAG: NAD(P)-dependent oxidoreductase [Sphingomonadales bacterium]|nr:NAD(P)-dependent oxidoreductase [Sphingomonadales bacterium]